MPQQATVYKVLISSPSDVPNERQIARNVVFDWNTQHASTAGIYLEPILWETHATYQVTSEGPQRLLHKQLIEDCDLVLGVFWSRIGTPTATARSGSAEEITHFLSKKKPAIVGFSKARIPPDDIDHEQFGQLGTYRKELERAGLVFTFSDDHEFKEKLSRALASSMKLLIEESIGAQLLLKKEDDEDKAAQYYDVKTDRKRLDLQATENHALDMEVLRPVFDVLQQRADPRKKLKVLDAGCGTGSVTNMRFSEFPNVEVLGIDTDQYGIERAQKLYERDGLSFQVADVHKFQSKKPFDFIFMMQLLHYVERPEEVTQKLWDQTSDGGAMLIQNSDDHLGVCFPCSLEFEEVVYKTGSLITSSDRKMGRKIYTFARRLTPKPSRIDVYLKPRTAFGASRLDRLNFFDETHGFRERMARKAHQVLNNRASKNALDQFRRVLLEEKANFADNEDIFAVEIEIYVAVFK